MEIIHHYGMKISTDREVQAFFDLGINLERGPQGLPGSSIVGLDISESHPRWAEVFSLVEKFKITDFVRTEFSKDELDAARVLCVLASLQRGYPAPADHFGYLGETYDLSEYCPQCGVGLRQVRPFRIKSIAALKRAVLQLNWVFDEFFVSREVWAHTFQPFGIGHWPVLSDKTGVEVESVVQLRISHHSELSTKSADAIRCSFCNRPKAPLVLRGFAPRPMDIPAPVFKSADYFGSGAGAFQRVFITHPVYESVRKNQLRGFVFYPCTDNSRAAPTDQRNPIP
jgi:hypothetical protein